MLQAAHMPSWLRVILLNKSGYDIDSTALIRSGIRFYVSDLQMETGSFLGNNCALYSSVRFPCKVIIGQNSKIAPEVVFCGSTHEIGTPNCRAGKVFNKDIVIGDGCWVGTRSILLPGVTIGSGSIIAAGAVVASNIPENELWGGVPAKKIRSL
ncbi:acyltransferase [Bifidobacterium eulemuris]|uniref:Acyltransferase n=3 Tax=Bifidobacterium eulemuris TaxID=1765219 RepID=A0A7L9SS50_9BIFI|nr:acyltransferase [Bifidobacterium eulemuris]